MFPQVWLGGAVDHLDSKHWEDKLASPGCGWYWDDKIPTATVKTVNAVITMVGYYVLQPLEKLVRVWQIYWILSDQSSRSWLVVISQDISEVWGFPLLIDLHLFKVSGCKSWLQENEFLNVSFLKDIFCFDIKELNYHPSALLHDISVNCFKWSRNKLINLRLTIEKTGSGTSLLQVQLK